MVGYREAVHVDYDCPGAIANSVFSTAAMVRKRQRQRIVRTTRHVAGEMLVAE